MRYLILLLLMGCTSYHTAIVINKGNNFNDLNTRVNDMHYIMPRVTIDEYDSIKIGDTLIIDKATLRVIH